VILWCGRYEAMLIRGHVGVPAVKWADVSNGRERVACVIKAKEVLAVRLQYRNHHYFRNAQDSELSEDAGTP